MKEGIPPHDRAHDFFWSWLRIVVCIEIHSFLSPCFLEIPDRSLLIFSFAARSQTPPPLSENFLITYEYVTYYGGDINSHNAHYSVYSNPVMVCFFKRRSTSLRISTHTG
jgi:hypothetical protein